MNYSLYIVGQYFDGLVQDCSNSIPNALELLQSCTKPSIWVVPKNAPSWANPEVVFSVTLAHVDNHKKPCSPYQPTISDVIINATASQITGFSIISSTVVQA